MIISLYAGGMTLRDIGFHLEHTLGAQLSHDTISKITDGILSPRPRAAARALRVP
jgi:putative transposase